MKRGISLLVCCAVVGLFFVDRAAAQTTSQGIDFYLRFPQNHSGSANLRLFYRKHVDQWNGGDPRYRIFDSLYRNSRQYYERRRITVLDGGYLQFLNCLPWLYWVAGSPF